MHPSASRNAQLPSTQVSKPDTPVSNDNQAVTCPRCGFDFHPPGSGNPTHGTIDNNLNLDAPQDAGSFDDAELQKLKELISSPSKELAGRLHMEGKRTLRPELYDNKNCAASKECRSPDDEQALEILARTAKKILEGVLRTKEGSPQALFESRCRGQSGLVFPSRPGLERVLKAVGAIVYDQEWTGRPCQGTNIPATTDYTMWATALSFNSEYVFEHMLLVDYGFPPSPIRCLWLISRDYFLNSELRNLENFAAFLAATACLWVKGQVPDSKASGFIARMMDAFLSGGLEVWDAATLLYWYHTRREPVDEERRKEGWTGYTGVLQEMIDEVPTRGTDRLARKLSLDVHVLIPKYIWGRKEREKMLFSARTLASQYGLSIELPEETTRGTGQGLLEAVAGWFPIVTRNEGPKEKED